MPRIVIETVEKILCGLLLATACRVGLDSTAAGGKQRWVASRDWVASLVAVADGADVTLQARVERTPQNFGRSGPVIHAVSIDIASSAESMLRNERPTHPNGGSAP
jgi:hypothetical protein